MKINEYLDSFENNFCDEVIATRNKTGKALKDIVGKKYEEHRRMLWESQGFDWRRKLPKSAFTADGYIYDNNGKLLVVEEAKGHYVDSCFLERALVGFVKQIKAFVDAGWTEKEMPYFVLSSTATMSNYEEKFEEFLGLFLDANPLKALLRKKVRYFAVSPHARHAADDKKFAKTGIGWFQVTHRPVPRTPETKALVKKELKFMEGLQ
jgi:hypothetical protein